jgi:cellulose synthase/poly-beta-1,6-N-acetylglucosamine synthase-like glycosyltransferase
VITALYLACAATLTALSLLAIYQWILALASMAPRRHRTPAPSTERSRFVVLIPAHNEEAGLAATLRSLECVDYPHAAVQIVVVADRCDDRTAAVAREYGVTCLERAGGPPGKGSAIAWALDTLQRDRVAFDALVIVDADTIAHRGLLTAFDDGLRAGHEVQQGYNYLSNPWDTPFTRIISVTSVLRNSLFYGGKERLGLPAMLSGTGMCFGRRLLERRGWTALSVGEDWEFSATLLLNGDEVHFNRAARVMASESRGFKQASSQRLRWASGRQAVAGTGAVALLRAGVRRRRLDLCDAALTIIAPTYSAQATLSCVCLATSWLLAASPAWRLLFAWSGGVTTLLAAYFLLGVALTESPAKALAGIVLIPAFLPWRMTIEVLGLFGYGRKRWVRTSRVVSMVAGSCVLVGGARADAQVIFQDDFEQDTIVNDIIGLWDGPHDPSTMYMTDQMSHSGRRSLELKYVPGSFGASFMYHEFPGQDQIHVRWYQRWSPGFVWEPSATKMVILRPIGGYPEFYPEVLWADGQLAIQAQVTKEANWDSEDFYQNQGDPVVFGGDRWYCVEVFVKLNTPGEADGEIAAWIDGELKMQYSGREFRGSLPTDPAPSIAQIQAVGATGYYGGVTEVPQLEFSWQDDFVVSTQPIGFQFLSDDFEGDTTDESGEISGWDGPARPPVMYESDQRPHSGARSLQLDYIPGSDGAGYMYRHFHGQQQVYVRWYQQWSTGFVWEPSGTGLVGVKTSTSYPQFYPFAVGADGTFAIQAQVVAEQAWGSENFFVNRGDPVSFVPDRWYCIEVFVKLNTPGAADGQLAAWIDGEQKLSYDGRQFRGSSPDDPAPSSAVLDALLATGQYGGPTPVPQLQTSWQDDYVGATERIGCQAYPPTVSK